jgi:hypothetical protein
MITYMCILYMAYVSDIMDFCARFLYMYGGCDLFWFFLFKSNVCLIVVFGFFLCLDNYDSLVLVG